MVITLDFETYRIVPGCPMAPKPVGASIKIEDTPSKYYAWGHPTHNNADFDTFSIMLKALWKNDEHQFVMHNAKFDTSIVLDYFKLNPQRPGGINDTMIMAYLNDPRDESLALKELSVKYLNRQPSEQADLKAYILSHIRTATEKTWGEFIAYAPGDLVGKYAEADTDMTYDLHQYFLPSINEVKRGKL